MIQQMKFCVCQRNSTKLGKPSKQAEKLKSRKMKDESRMMKKDEGWWFLAVDGFWFMTDEQTDICECRVAFATEKSVHFLGKENFLKFSPENYLLTHKNLKFWSLLRGILTLEGGI